MGNTLTSGSLKVSKFTRSKVFNNLQFICKKITYFLQKCPWNSYKHILQWSHGQYKDYRRGGYAFPFSKYMPLTYLHRKTLISYTSRKVCKSVTCSKTKLNRLNFRVRYTLNRNDTPPNR